MTTAVEGADRGLRSSSGVGVLGWISARTDGVLPAKAPPEIAEWVIEPCYDDPFPDYDTEPVMMYANG